MVKNRRNNVKGGLKKAIVIDHKRVDDWCNFAFYKKNAKKYGKIYTLAEIYGYNTKEKKADKSKTKMEEKKMNTNNINGKIAVITLEGGVWSDGNKKLATDPKIVEWLINHSQVKEDGEDETHCFIDSDTDEMKKFVEFMKNKFGIEIYGYNDMHFVLNYLPKGTKFILFVNREYDWTDWVETGDFKKIEHLIIINENNLMEV